MKFKNTVNILSGLGIGFVNALLGAGGGMLAVPVLKKSGLSQKQAHINAVAVILPISVLSAALYMKNGYVTLADAYIYLPTGLLGALLGTFLMKKISPLWLKRIFGAFMVYAGIRLLIK